MSHSHSLIYYIVIKLKIKQIYLFHLRLRPLVTCLGLIPDTRNVSSHRLWLPHGALYQIIHTVHSIVVFCSSISCVLLPSSLSSYSAVGRSLLTLEMMIVTVKIGLISKLKCSITVIKDLNEARMRWDDLWLKMKSLRDSCVGDVTTGSPAAMRVLVKNILCDGENAHDPQKDWGLDDVMLCFSQVRIRPVLPLVTQLNPKYAAAS